MHSRDSALFRAWLLAVVAHSAACGQSVGGRPYTALQSAGPTITILDAATGALLRSHGANNAFIDFGHISYFRGNSAPGQISHKNSRAVVISTQFALRVDCPGSVSSSRVNVTMSRSEAAPSHSISIDGTTLGPGIQTLAQSVPCGSRGDHRLDVEVPVSTPAGSIESTVAFVATLNK